MVKAYYNEIKPSAIARLKYLISCNLIARGDIDDRSIEDVMGILDRTDYRSGFQHVGCEDLAQRVTTSVPKVHVFGHIHNGYGQKQIGQTLYVNAAICDEDYKPVNAPVVVDI